MTIEDFLKRPYVVVDIFPRQISPSFARHYLEVEKSIMSYANYPHIYKKFTWLILKLCCYVPVSLSIDGEKWKKNPTPQEFDELVTTCSEEDLCLYILVGKNEGLFTFTWKDHYMTLYGVGGPLLDIIRELATSEGLFIWKPAATSVEKDKDLLERVGEMEERFSRLKEAVGYYSSIRSDITALRTYLESGQFQSDYEADEKGMIRGNVSRGVLSQDELYNLLEEADKLLRDIARGR